MKTWNVAFVRSEIIIAGTREEAEEIAEDFKRKQEMIGKIEETNEGIFGKSGVVRESVRKQWNQTHGSEERRRVSNMQRNQRSKKER